MVHVSSGLAHAGQRIRMLRTTRGLAAGAAKQKQAPVRQRLRKKTMQLRQLASAQHRPAGRRARRARRSLRRARGARAWHSRRRWRSPSCDACLSKSQAVSKVPVGRPFAPRHHAPAGFIKLSEFYSQLNASRGVPRQARERELAHGQLHEKDSLTTMSRHEQQPARPRPRARSAHLGSSRAHALRLRTSRRLVATPDTRETSRRRSARTRRQEGMPRGARRPPLWCAAACSSRGCAIADSGACHRAACTACACCRR